MGRTPKSKAKDQEDILGINHPSVSRKHLQIFADPVIEGSSVSRSNGMSSSADSAD